VYDSGAALGPEFQINTTTAENQITPAVTGAPDGSFVVAWTSFSQDGYLSRGIFAQRFDSAGAPAGAEFQVNSMTLNDQLGPVIAADGDGDFVIAWQSYGQDGEAMGSIFAQRFASGGAPLGLEFQVNTFTPDQQIQPAIAMDPTGQFVVAWQSRSQDGADFGVFGQRFTSGGTPLGAEFQINTRTTLNQQRPAVTMGPSGQFSLVWQSDQQDDSLDGIFGQHYDSSGAPLGSELQVNSFTSLSQRFAAISNQTTDRFVVVWESLEQDGPAGSGVFGQRFAAAKVAITGVSTGGGSRLRRFQRLP
jgi:hypothetical protein